VEEKLKVSHKMSSIGRLTGSVFHEILNPVNIISAHTQLLLIGAEKGSSTEDDLNSIKEEIERIVTITEKLQEFSRSNKSDVETVELNCLIEDILSLIKPELNIKSIKLITNFDMGQPEVMAHGDDLRQAFLNSITNAMDAMPNGGTLTIKTQVVRNSEFGVQSTEGKNTELKTQYSELKGDSVRITFEDTGCGIAEKDIDRVFEPFFSTKKEIKGVGLGLSTSYATIEGYGGKISVESEEGKGSTFIFDLPINS
jgi:two-component system NtrC family sensor kinase